MPVFAERRSARISQALEVRIVALELREKIGCMALSAATSTSLGLRKLSSSACPFALNATDDNSCAVPLSALAAVAPSMPRFRAAQS